MTDRRSLEFTEDSTSPFRQLSDSLTARALVIGILGLLMLIPLSAVHDVVRERDGLYRSALADIAGIWGAEQTIQGPLLVVPYIESRRVEETARGEDGEEKTVSKVVYTRESAVLLPDDLAIDVDIEEEFRHRGIYDALVYTAAVELRGHFSPPTIESISDHLHEVEWEKAYLVLALTDTRAINEASVLQWDGEPRKLAPGTRLTELLPSGFHAPLKGLAATGGLHSFDLRLSFNGSRGLRFAPFGETTEVRMTSSWPHPSFQGSALPTRYETREDGFEAAWSIPHLARNYPQRFAYTAERYDLSEFLTGVDLFEPVFLYSKITRAVKYGLLFVGLTFLVFLIFELAAGTRLHFVQYGLIGLALSLFYLTLLSLAEHIPFLRAYAVASSVIIGMIGLYTGAVTRRISRASIVIGVLTTLYILLYSLLHLESYALLLGTALLVAVVATLMYLTRNLEPATRQGVPHHPEMGEA